MEKIGKIIYASENQTGAKLRKELKQSGLPDTFSSKIEKEYDGVPVVKSKKAQYYTDIVESAGLTVETVKVHGNRIRVITRFE